MKKFIFFTLLYSVAIACTTALVHAHEADKGFANIIEKLLPSVVNISTEQEISQAQGLENFGIPEGSPLEEFFKRFKEGQGEQAPSGPPRKATSLGSGFIIDEAGYIVTNSHVIDGASAVKVILHDNTEYEATIIGKDKRTDLALLKIEADKDLVAVNFADSDKANIGDWAIAIGNPLGLGGTVTLGIISARGRDIHSGPYDNYIQTDASINRGNSGGPLFNAKGDVIGINTAIFSQTGGSIGIGFAIPANQASKVIKQLKEFGETKRGWLGVTIQPVTKEIAESLGLDKEQGALVADVHKDGPSDKAGIKVGDIILSFDGEKVKTSRELPRIVASRDISKNVSVIVFRDGQNITINVTLGRLESALKDIEQQYSANQPNTDNPQQVGALGFNVVALNDTTRQQFDIVDIEHGVVVSYINENSEAFKRGLRKASVIALVNQREIRNVADYDQALNSAYNNQRAAILLLVYLNGDQRFISLPLDKE